MRARAGFRTFGILGAGCPVLSVVATTPPGTDARRNGPMDAARSAAPDYPTTVSIVSIGSSEEISDRRSSQCGGMHMCVPSSSSDSSIRKPWGVP